jgi:TRAP-type mannitol/chloroaromatic compound transport system permease large subunit
VSEALAGTLLLALLFLFFSLGLEIAFSLGLVGLLGLFWLKGWTIGLGVVGSVSWSNASSFSFVAVPLFVFMSAILLHAGIGQSLYAAVARWSGSSPRPAVASVFAAPSSPRPGRAATAATIGMIAIPEMSAGLSQAAGLRSPPAAPSVS